MPVFLGLCLVRRGEIDSWLPAAVFCADPSDYEARLRAELFIAGYQLVRMDDVLPADQWIARHRAPEAPALARMAQQTQQTALGRPIPAAAAQDCLVFDAIAPVTPLDAQFDRYPKQPVPDILLDALFGQPDPTPADHATFGSDVPPMATYAVLDAAKMPYLLTGLIDVSGLRAQSLFQGEAQEELGEYAPYLVELAADNKLTRLLFTESDSAGGLWNRELGIILRSRMGFDAMRKHLRRFTRVQDQQGKWFYFRFWEGRCLPDYFAQLASLPDRAAHFFCNASGAPVSWIIPEPLATKVAVIYSKPWLTAAHATPPFILGDLEIAVFSQIRLSAFQSKLAAYLGAADPAFAARPAAQKQQWVAEVTQTAQLSGITIEKCVADYAEACLAGGAALFQDRRVNAMLASNAHQADKASFLLATARTLKTQQGKATV